MSKEKNVDRIGLLKLGPWVLVPALLVLLLSGCGSQATTEVSASQPGYDGVLHTTYENALQPVDQLALGTLKLEETANAVSEAQAAHLLPLWQALQGDELQGDAERGAVERQIEATMTEAQLSAIAGMRLTQDDVQAWMQSQGIRAMPGGGEGQGGRGRQGGGAQLPGMSAEQVEQMRQQFQDMTPEERATRRVQFAQQGDRRRSGQPATGGTLAGMGLNRAVIALLTRRSGQAVAGDMQPAATPTTVPTPAPTAQRTRPVPTASPATVRAPTQAAEQVNTPVPTPTPAAPGAAEPMPTPTPALRAPQAEAPGSGGVPAATPVPALVQVEDTDPGPPFTVEVSANTATQDPLVQDSRRYKITGLVRNDGEQTYAVSALHVTFFDAKGFRGTYQRFPGRGRTGGEWVWHGQTEADLACLLLAPGEECPFGVEITAQDMGSFLIHPDAVATERVSAPVELGGVRLVDEGTGYLRISGTATNDNPFAVKNVTVSGTLIDASGQIVSVGSTYVLEKDIAPGASVPFDVRVEKMPYVRYQLYAQAERD